MLIVSVSVRNRQAQGAERNGGGSAGILGAGERGGEPLDPRCLCVETIIVCSPRMVDA
jgi:hypothetical protein